MAQPRGEYKDRESLQHQHALIPFAENWMVLVTDEYHQPNPSTTATHILIRTLRMDRLSLDPASLHTASLHSRLTEVLIAHFPDFVSWFSGVLQDHRLQEVASGYSRGSQDSTLQSNEIPGTIPAESVRPPSILPDERSSLGTVPRDRSKIVHFQEPADDLSVRHDKNSNSVETPAKGVLKNGLGDTPPGQRVATSHPHRGDGVPAADTAIDSIEERANPDSGSVSSNTHLAEATAFPVFDHLDRYSDVSSLSDASNDGRPDVENRALSENPHAYSSAEEDKAMRRGQTLTGEAPLQFNGVHEQPNDAESYISTRSHQPGRLSPIDEVCSVGNYDSDRDDASHLNVNDVDSAAGRPKTPERLLRNTRSFRNLGGRGRRFSSEQLDGANTLPTEQAEVPAAGSTQHQSETSLQVNDTVGRNLSLNGSDVFNQIHDSISDIGERLSCLESAFRSLISTIESFLSTGSSRLRDRDGDALDEGLNETLRGFQLPVDPQLPLSGDAQNNQPEVVTDGKRGDAPLTSGFSERPGSPVLSLASAAPAEGTPPAKVRKGGRREYPIRKDPNGS